MKSDMSSSPRAGGYAAPFHTTRWTLVLVAKSDSEEGHRALAELCEAYYEPVVAYLRLTLRDGEAAREMAHAFFARVLAGGSMGTADRDRGRFRSYLLGAVKHFVSHQMEAAMRLKRGGQAMAVPLDDTESLQMADGRNASPDLEFDRRWAMTVIARSLEALRSECSTEGREGFFQLVSGILSGQASHGEQAALAVSCGMTFDAFRMAVSRLKKRLRELVKIEVAGTLEEPAAVQAELEALFMVLRR